MAPYIIKELDFHLDNLILEGAFLSPQELQNKGKLILIVTTNEEQHKNQYFNHRNKDESNYQTFKVARMIQNYLIREAKDLRIEVIENNFNFQAI